MKITQALWRQHIGRMTKRHWWVQGKKVLYDTTAEKYLIEKGIEVKDAQEAVKPATKEFTKLDSPLVFQKSIVMDNTHPDWNEKPCLKYGHNNLIIDGLDQGQLLIKAELIKNELPERLQALEEEQSPEMEDLIQRVISSSHIFDAHQEKLPKKKDPLRPQWVYPRIYGIPDARKVHNLTQKLLHICDMTSGPVVAQQRKLVHGEQVRAYIEKGEDLLYFESSIDTMIMSKKLLTPMSNKKDFSTPFPNLGPLDPTISLQPQHIYNLQDQFPVVPESPWSNVHTIFINFESENVKNITERPVNESQILARSMLHSFGTAVCCAKQKFGEETMDLPEPVTVQCVQSDGKWFYFSVLQLNTLNIAGLEGTRNIWWHSPRIDLFEKAGYFEGKPVLEEYNPAVFQKILAFYRNV